MIRKEDAPDPYGALEQVHPYHEGEGGWTTILQEINRYQFSTSTARTAFQERVWQLCRDPIWEPRPMASLPRIFLVVQPGRRTGCRTQSLDDLVPCHRVMGKMDN